MSAPFYSFDPCVCTGMPCGACYPYSTKPCAASRNDLGVCSVCPGGGCSPCPAPVRPCPCPCPAPPILPCLPPCPPCDKVCRIVEQFCELVMICHGHGWANRTLLALIQHDFQQVRNKDNLFQPGTPVPKPEPLCDTVAIPICRPNRCKPCPCYCCTEAGVCSPKRCSYPGVPVCAGNCGPCMPVW